VKVFLENLDKKFHLGKAVPLYPFAAKPKSCYCFVTCKRFDNLFYA